MTEPGTIFWLADLFEEAHPRAALNSGVVILTEAVRPESGYEWQPEPRRESWSLPFDRDVSSEEASD